MLQSQTVDAATMELLKKMTWKQVKTKIEKAVKSYLK